MKCQIATLLILSVLAGQSKAQTFTIEQNEALQSLPVAVEQAVINDNGSGAYDSEIFSQCRLYGMPIKLSGSVREDGYLVSTKGCGGGSAAIPLWVVHITKNSPRVVLADGGVLLSLGKAKRHGMRDIALTSQNAGSCWKSLYRFNGKQYEQYHSFDCSKH